MKIYQGIAERAFKIHDDISFSKTLFPGIEDIKDYLYAYCVYIDNAKITPIFGHVTNTIEEIGTFSFKDYLEKYMTNDFQQLIFLLDSYHCSIRKYQKLIDPTNRYSFQKYDVVDSLLSNSVGVLLWHYQIENLFNLFYNCKDKIVKLRKGINHKKLDAFNIAGSLRLNDCISLEDVIDERMIYKNTCYPNHLGAFRLFKYLNKQAGDIC